MARFTKMNPKDYKRMTWDAGIAVDEDGFDPETGELTVDKIAWATTGDNSFSATHEMTDMGADINNAPEGTMQLQKPNSWQAQLTGTAVTVTPSIVKQILGNADVDTANATKIVPRNTLDISDFLGKWLITNYSEDNTEAKGGWMAIHIKNALSTEGFSSTFSKNANGQFPYTLKAFYDMNNLEDVPFEIYIKEGGTVEGGGGA